MYPKEPKQQNFSSEVPTQMSPRNFPNFSKTLKIYFLSCFSKSHTTTLAIPSKLVPFCREFQGHHFGTKNVNFRSLKGLRVLFYVTCWSLSSSNTWTIFKIFFVLISSIQSVCKNRAPCSFFFFWNLVCWHLKNLKPIFVGKVLFCFRLT